MACSIGSFYLGLHEGAVYIGEEDSKRWSNFLLDLQAEILVCVMPKKRRIEKELKMMDNKNKNAICALLFTGLNN